MRNIKAAFDYKVNVAMYLAFYTFKKRRNV